jgi:hypothetical protein
MVLSMNPMKERGNMWMNMGDMMKQMGYDIKDERVTY